MKVDLHSSPTPAILAALHAEAFDEAWSEADFAILLASPGVFSLMACANETPIGFVLVRVAADEAEILTLAVNPDSRRCGAGRKLVEAAAERAAHKGATSLFLEVAEDNAAALALYAACSFEHVGRRKGYYAKGLDRIDALALRRDLNRLSGGQYA